MRSFVFTVIAASALSLGGCAAASQPPVSQPATSPRPPQDAGGGSDVAALEAICAAEPPEGEAFELDAQAYADEFGVSLDEAINRLSLQNVTGVQEAGIAAAPDLWAAYWLEHEPDFGYVLFYRGEPADVAHIRAVVADCSIPIIVRSGAQFAGVAVRFVEESLPTTQ